MASIKELVGLFNHGELGKLLARTFNGERGRVYPREDSDLIITFRSESETPSAEAIGQAVAKHFTGLGYVVIPDARQGMGCFQATVYAGSKEDFCVYVVVTTHYPFPAPGQGNASLRITSTFIC